LTTPGQAAKTFTIRTSRSDARSMTSRIIARLFSRSSMSGLAKFDRLSIAQISTPSAAAADLMACRSRLVRSSGEATGRLVSIDNPSNPSARALRICSRSVSAGPW
jgi:hypothetical protein